MLRMVCQLLKLITKGTQVSDLFPCKIKYKYVMYSFLVLMFIMFPIIKLRNNMVAGQNKPQTLNYD